MKIKGFYAGVGSRNTPDDICNLIKKISSKLEDQGWVLRSGGANGADIAFENGIKNSSMAQIFLPWNGFNGNKSIYHRYSPEHMKLAIEFHPNWKALSQGARKMMIRNSAQIIGVNDEPNSSFVICYTTDGKFSGGTGQALRLASSKGIPVFNLHDPNIKDRFVKFIEC
jgi:hypothetical protein